MMMELYNMRICSTTDFMEDFPIVISETNIHRQLIKEAMSKRDFMSTLMALMSFVMLPNETKETTDLDVWLSARGGSQQTASQIAQSVGKPNPKGLTVNELNKIKTQTVSMPPGTSIKPTVPSTVPKAEIDHHKKSDTAEAPKPPVPYQSYWQGRDKKYRSELTESIIDNSILLMKKVNGLLKELGIANAKVNSGWRPPSYNEELRRQGKPAAPKSKHISGEAVDLSDIDRTITNAILKNPSILDKYGLWMEDPSRTRTWAHFDLGTGRDPHRMPDGSPRKSRIFKP